MLLLLLLALQDEKAQVDVAARDAGWTIPADLRLRARVVAVTPAAPGPIRWRHGGEGLGGSVTSGVFAERLELGAWSPPLAVASLVKGSFPSRLFLTVVAGAAGKRGRDGAQEGHSTGVELEFELSRGDRALKTFREKGPDGGTVGLVIPAYRLAGGGTPGDPAFLDECEGLSGYAARRAAALEKLAGPFPRKFGIVTNLNGYGTGSGYGIRHTNPEITRAELRALRALGVNGLGQGPAFLDDEPGFQRLRYAQLGGYPLPPDEPCPFGKGVDAHRRAMIERGLAEALRQNADEVWWRTEDEIGAVVDRAPEGKAHYATCEACAEGFRDFLRGRGLKPEELGASAWDGVRPADIWRPEPLDLSSPERARVAVETAHFNNYASARLFTPLREALAKANAERTSKRPLVHSFALRGNTFLMGGHSLDFFDFYRHADNAFVYETSNRDARVWGWDSYLCDVGRVMSAEQGLRFGVYVKPHRGAPVQRALSAVARGATMLFWYTYGPDYAKGDTFAGDPETLARVSKAAALLGRTEDVLYGARGAKAPEIAVVTPRTSEIWWKLSRGSAAAHENAKWVWSALRHAQLAVDPLDEVQLERADLSRYKAIYVNGPHLTRAAAARLADWVKAGGTLCTSGGGLAFDEAGRPLRELEPPLGLKARRPVELWSRVRPYGGAGLDPFDPPTPRPEAAIGGFTPRVGREALDPAEGTEVLARFADGSAAMTRRAHGRGQAYVVGFFPGLEYSAAARREDFDLSVDFDPALRAYVDGPALRLVKPDVEASSPLVEGALLRHPESGRRALVLMNWAYRVSEKRVVNKRSTAVKTLVPVRDGWVRLRGAGDVARASSAALGRDLELKRDADGLLLSLPLLEEGDVVRLD